MALNQGIWDPKLRGPNIKGTNLKSLTSSMSRRTKHGSFPKYGEPQYEPQDLGRICIEMCVMVVF